jgi:gamma-glutamylputrescine oxidase
MTEEVYWRTRRRFVSLPALQENIEADAVIVGGGISGLSTAQYLLENLNSKVILLESRYCGAGATGRSSGFITPDSELELNQLVNRFGGGDAKHLWAGAIGACDRIRDNIESFKIECDKVDADSLFIANGQRSFATVRKEHEAHRRCEFPSQLYRESEIQSVLGSDKYNGAHRTPDTFGIDPFAYVQQLRDSLVARGLEVFEETPATEIAGNLVRTPHGNVRAKQIFICMDRYAPDLGIASRDNYHAQTFLILSEPLDAAIRKRLFPEKPMLVWDTDLVYQYFRLTGENRLLVGGGLLRYSFRRHMKHGCNRAVQCLLSYIRRKFRFLEDVRFSHYWPGLIGITKDLLPLAGRSPKNPNHFYAMCAAGLPWSTLAGQVAARQAVEGATEFDDFFAPGRAFSILEPLQPVTRKPLTFAVSTYNAKQFQRGHAIDIARKRQRVRIALGTLAAATVASAAFILNRRRRHV